MSALKKTLIFLIFLFFYEAFGQSKVANVLIILSDDHSVEAISSYNGRYKSISPTKHIDQLAENGVLFQNYFATNSICSPSRASILTGKYSHKNGVYCLNQKFDSTQQHLGTYFRKAGYATGLFGKWHLGSRPVGFDSYKVLEQQGKYSDPTFIENNKTSKVHYNGWTDDLITSFTKNFIQESKKPFFVMCNLKAIHDPWSSRAPFDTLYTGKFIQEPENLNETYENRSRALQNASLKLEMINQETYMHKRLDNASDLEQRGYIYQQYIKDYLRGVQFLDEKVGELVSFLRNKGLLENTILVYTTDQGHFLGEHGLFSKRFSYEESLQCPLIISYPAKITKGIVIKGLAANIDLAPSILDLCGLEIPKDIQGASFKENLLRDHEKPLRKEVYFRYWQHLLHRNVVAHYGIRTKNYKLIYYYGEALGHTDYPSTLPEWEFFDLQKDPLEMTNEYLNPKYQKTIRILKKQLTKAKVNLEDML